MSGSCWTPQAVEEAAHAMWDDDHRGPATPGYTIPPIPREHRDPAAMEQYRIYARAALAAAEPFLREALARDDRYIAVNDIVGALRWQASLHFGDTERVIYEIADALEADPANLPPMSLRAGVPAPEPCATCKGTGTHVEAFASPPLERCPDCNGSGRRVPAPEPTKGNTP